jgi:tetratricopeptide (TPR) repeat protein
VILAAAVAAGLGWAQEYDEKDRQAAAWLDVPVAFTADARDALELLYDRRYGEAHAAFAVLTQRYPTTGVGPAGDAATWYAEMFEHLDLRYETQWQAATDAALAQVAEGEKTPGFEGPEQFLAAGMLGIEAIHALRKGEFLAALGGAYRAVVRIARVKEVAPDMVDARLADGMYLVWRTEVTRGRALPQFPDRQAEGLALIERVAREGVFLAPAARLCLGYTLMSMGRFESAAPHLAELQAEYPANVIVLTTAGRISTGRGDSPAAQSAFAAARSIDPRNLRVRFFSGIDHFRAGRHAEAQEDLLAFATRSRAPSWAREEAYRYLQDNALAAGDAEGAARFENAARSARE